MLFTHNRSSMFIDVVSKIIYLNMLITQRKTKKIHRQVAEFGRSNYSPNEQSS